jgi:hypothetical protein
LISFFVYCRHRESITCRHTILAFQTVIDSLWHKMCQKLISIFFTFITDSC